MFALFIVGSESFTNSIDLVLCFAVGAELHGGQLYLLLPHQ